tara:strand:+ start:637 stop:3072 length:2436 start_codon:yes stop_codon:yes gene_type:complete
LAGSYQAKIDVIVGGLREVAALEGRLESLQATITAINKDPIDLNRGGKGIGRDLSGKLSKNVNDLVRNFDNFGKSFASVNKQAGLFGDLMSQTALKSTGDFKRQDVAVRNLATAYTTATSQAARFDKQQINLIRTSKGLQTSVQREIELINRRNKVSALRDKKRRGENMRQDLSLGVGFPLLFGGGAGAVAGGALGAVAGGGKGGFGLQILFSALGQQVDNFFASVEKSASSVAAALDGTSSSLEAVKEAGIVVRDSTIEYVKELEDSGRSLDAYNAVQRELNNIYGVEGVAVLQELKSANSFANTEAGKLSAVLQTELAPVFILLAQLGGGAAQALRNVIPAIADAIGEFTLGIPGASTTAQASKQRPGNNPALVAANERQKAQELRTDAEIQQITAVTEELRRQTSIAQLNNDLTDERVVSLRKSSIEIKAQNEISSLQDEALKNLFNTDLQRLNAAKIQKIKQQETADLAKLEASARKAVAPKAKKIKKNIVPGLKLEIQLQERLLALNTKIAEAKRNGNEGAAAVLEVEKIFEQTAANINKIRTEGLGKEAKTLKIESEQLKGLQKVEAVNNRMRDAKAKEAEKVEELVGNLENEGALIKAKLNGREDEVRLTQEIAEKTEGLGETDAKRVADLIRGNAELEKQTAIADRMQQIYDQIGQSIASGVVDTLSAAVDQTKSLADAAANTLRNIANILLQLGINTALQGTGLGIFKNLGGFADGGRPPVGKPSIVGERGPELFVPNTSGTIVPNNKLGGGGATNVVVNVDAKGSSASGDSGAGKQLGGLIGAAVQAELIKQQRPGGLLSR